jgi:hypothetical protein
VAATYPVASASSSIIYAYDPEIDAIRRRPGLLGPILGERAETVGKGKFDFGVTYSYVDLATIDGESMDDLVNAPRVKGRFLFFPVPGGITLKDGRRTELLPVRVDLDLDVDAHIVAPSFTYGVTPDFDLNLTVPLLRTSVGVEARTQVPDPRWPHFALPAGDPHARVDVLPASESSEGVGDVLLRAKYVLWRGPPADIAAGLGLSLPSGRAADFHGRGTTLDEPGLIASRAVGKRIELLANAAADLDAEDVDRSALRWAVGGTIALIEPVVVPIVFFGRHELAAPAERIRLPFFFQIHRSDAFDASVGLRWRFRGAAVLSANALVPLNDEGLRAAVVPTIGFEHAF